MHSLSKFNYTSSFKRYNDNTSISTSIYNSLCTLQIFRYFIILFFTCCIILQLTFCSWNDNCEIDSRYIYITYGRHNINPNNNDINNNNNFRTLQLHPNPLPVEILSSDVSTTTTTNAFQPPVVSNAVNHHHNYNNNLPPSYSLPTVGRSSLRNRKKIRGNYFDHRNKIPLPKPSSNKVDNILPFNKPKHSISFPKASTTDNNAHIIHHNTMKQQSNGNTKDVSNNIHNFTEWIRYQVTHLPSMTTTSPQSIQASNTQVSSITVQGTPSPNYWTSKTQLRSSTEVIDRLSWYTECLRISRYRPFGQLPDYRTGTTGAEALLPTQLRKDYYNLKYMAFIFYEYFNYLWNETHPDAPPQADWDFYAGPWVEDYWRYTFGRPIRRNVTIAEWQYQVNRMGSNTIRALTMPNDLTEDELLSNLSADDQTNYANALAWYYHMEGTGKIPTIEELNILDNYDLPMVEIEEPFDYDLFYPYVPLFIPWERLSVATFGLYKLEENDPRRIALQEWINKLEKRILEFTISSVAYITVAQRAQGIILYEHSTLRPLLSNTLVINAGGGGDIPIPLLAGEQPILNNVPEFGEHKYWLSFIGSAREGLRADIITKTNQRYGIYNTSIIPSMNEKYSSRFINTYFYTQKEKSDSSSTQSPWMTMMGTSMLQLAPRGTNPTSFRLYEALQMGLIPVYIYDKERPWLPYYRHNNDTKFVRYPSSVDSPWQLWDRIGFIVHIDDYDAFLDILPELASNGTWYRSMRQSIAEVRDLYFTYEGVIRQIYRMLLNPRLSDLTCSLPAQLFF